jgi:predicted O-linked N-acetylglucosamine transferase (SPINDLY family)
LQQRAWIWDLTRELKASSDHWRDITLLSDDQAASLIRSDAIDILIDLSGYTRRLAIAGFMRRPAPVRLLARLSEYHRT